MKLSERGLKRGVQHLTERKIVVETTTRGTRKSLRLQQALLSSVSDGSRLENVTEEKKNVSLGEANKKKHKKSSPRGKEDQSLAANKARAHVRAEEEATPQQFYWKHGTLGRDYEIRLIKTKQKAASLIVGVDEAGRGPLAGPVVAAACAIPLEVTIHGVQDSKKLNEEEREHLYQQLTQNPRVRYAVSVIEREEIDRINILQASLKAMKQAVEALAQVPDYVFIDGHIVPPDFPHDCETVVKGDSKVFPIAAASIIAKVTRDRLMLALDKKFPVYGFATNKGYPTKAHFAALKKFGPCDAHRTSYAPVREWLAANTEPKVER